MQKLHNKVTKVAQSASERITRVRQGHSSLGLLDLRDHAWCEDEEIVLGTLVTRQQCEPSHASSQAVTPAEIEELQHRLLAKKTVAALLQSQLDTKSLELLESERSAGELIGKVSEALDGIQHAVDPRELLSGTCVSLPTSPAKSVKDVLARLATLKASLSSESQRLSQAVATNELEFLECVESQGTVWVCGECGEDNRSCRMRCNNCSRTRESISDSETSDNAVRTLIDPTHADMDSKQSSAEFCGDDEESHPADLLANEEVSQTDTCMHLEQAAKSDECELSNDGASSLHGDSSDEQGEIFQHWTCCKCGEENRKSRPHCNNCGQAQESNEDLLESSDATSSTCGPSDNSSNDELIDDALKAACDADVDAPIASGSTIQYWICHRCGEENRPSRSECNNCSYSRCIDVNEDEGDVVLEQAAPEETITSEVIRRDADVTASCDAACTSEASDVEQVTSIPALPLEAVASQVVLHIYDVSTDQRVQRVNEALRAVGARSGAFHAGVEVYGKEWCYGYVAFGTGVSYCTPKCNVSHRYRESIVMGVCTFKPEEVADIIRQMQKDWPGDDYDLLSRNCCHFTDALCRKLGVGSIPAWVTELATAGATLFRTVSTATSAVQDAVGAAAFKAVELDDTYQISRTMETMLTREIDIDASYFETKVQDFWNQTKGFMPSAWTPWGSTTEVQAPLANATAFTV